MPMRLSDLNDYSQAVATRPTARPLTQPVVPDVYAAEALTRRGCNGLALSELPGPRRAEVRLNGLGELVQVVT